LENSPPTPLEKKPTIPPSTLPPKKEISKKLENQKKLLKATYV
jgi:hypothetical protein